MFIADLHVHSKYSDGQLTVPELVDFYGKQGFGAIAITDHVCEDSTFLGKAAKYLEYTLTEESFPHYFQELQEQAERAWFQYRMIVMPGLELSKNSLINQRSAHILALNISEFISADAEILDIVKEIREQNALSVAAHPVWTGKMEPQTYHLWQQKEELENYIDAWEVASGPRLFTEVARSKLKKIATSDLHNPQQIESWKTVFNCERHPEAIMQAIRKQDVNFRFYKSYDQNSINQLKV
ncbi:MAG: PHP domain-containing protein [Pseudobdellovibrionaceae bacterium]